jgi:transglutaminase-like putative cysteine protease
MRSIQYPPVYLGTLAFLITAVAAAFAHLPFPANLPYVLAFALFYAAGLICGWHYRKSNLQVFRLINYFVLGIGFIIWLRNSYILRWDANLVVLLMWIQAANNFTLSKRRDVYLAYVVSLVLVFRGAAIAVTTSYVSYMVVYVLAGMFALMTDLTDEKLASAQSGDREVLTRGLHLPVKGIGLAVLVLCLAFVIYLLFPRLPSPGIAALDATQGSPPGHIGKEAGERAEKGGGYARQKLDDQTQSYAGFKKSFDITELQESTDNRVVFYLWCDRPIYARVKTFDTFDGTTWTNRWKRKSTPNRNGRWLECGPSWGQTHAQFIQFIQVYDIKTNLSPLIATGYRATALLFPTPFAMDTDDVLEAPVPLWSGTRYSVISEIQYIEEGRSCSAGDPKNSLWRNYMSPSPGTTDRFLDLVRGITDNVPGYLQKAIAIEQYLQSNFKLARKPRAEGWGNDPVDELLFQTKEGPPEFFATAMALMLRRAGIASRLVAGYRVTRFNPFVGRYDARLSDRHVWVEGFVPGRGWVTFEPTPGFSLPGSVRDMIAFASFFRYVQERIDWATRKNPTAWWSGTIAALKDALERLKTFVVTHAREIIRRLVNMWVGLSIQSLVFLILLLVGACCLVFFRRFLLPVFKQMQMYVLSKGDPTRFVLSCYGEVERIFAAKGVARQKSLAPAEYEARVASTFPSLGPAAGTLTSLFEIARYSPYPVQKEDARKAYDAYRSLVRSGERAVGSPDKATSSIADDVPTIRCVCAAASRPHNQIDNEEETDVSTMGNGQNDTTGTPILPWHIYNSKWCWSYIPMGAVLICVSVWFWLALPLDLPGVVLLIPISAIAIGIWLIRRGIRLCRDRGPQVTIANEGIYSKQWPWQFVPWERVTDADYLGGYYTTTTLVLEVTGPEDFLKECQQADYNRFSTSGKWLGSPIFVVLGELSVNPERLADAIKRFSATKIN